MYAALLADVNMLMIEQARSATSRSYDLIRDALACSDREADACGSLAKALKSPLIDNAKYHGATVGPAQATKLGLPVKIADPESKEWKLVWSLWTRYFHLGVWPQGQTAVYEGRLASQVIERK